ncbi:hypothetical protein DACRYDRAFT_108725 [Dacryopinax primogenitus]|uniref:Uncharacterized protein n=1 Tax=Dacryopinax primogenitus (strain DJM 731) TaxID=1858805 RepID=M5FXZ4_DACPD|nr:uncharacterized protein DACRYDRAFT_108725 [Dacryopinax primogenitus]EJU00655.1 hypothetical protein DACRYDRAFT_108725 [Dacryopinax primogenitus]
MVSENIQLWWRRGRHQVWRRSKAREKVLGYFDKPRPSGYAVYRAWFTAKAKTRQRTWATLKVAYAASDISWVDLSVASKAQ